MSGDRRSTTSVAHVNTSNDLELWFDFSCPYAYLASRRAPTLAHALGVGLAWKPMLLGGVFRGTGAGEGPMATLGVAKAAHNAADMHRWAELFGVPFRVPAAHPMRTVRALRVLLALPHSRWPPAIEAIYAAYWQRGEDVTRDDVIASALRAAGTSEVDVTAALARADDMKDELRRRTDEAIALGVFGAPAWVIRKPTGHALVWGQDRIAGVEAALAGRDLDAPGPARPFGEGLQGFRSPHALDVYFDVASPFAYLGLTQVGRLAELCGVAPRLQPILLGGLFRAIGQVDVPLFGMPEAKRRYVRGEMERWARWWGVPFDMPRKFPQRTVTAQRLCVLPEDGQQQLRFAIALGRAMWAEQRDLEDADTLRGVLADCGLPREWVERTQEPASKAALAERTAMAQAAGVFGVPTFVVAEKYLFWGQDRLELVMRALGGWRPEHG
jgi:2-hydroxychromene-2-carboxylate isomerase